MLYSHRERVRMGDSFQCIQARLIPWCRPLTDTHKKINRHQQRCAHKDTHGLFQSFPHQLSFNFATVLPSCEVLSQVLGERPGVSVDSLPLEDQSGLKVRITVVHGVCARVCVVHSKLSSAI